MTDSVDRLYDAVIEAKDSDPGHSRTARLFRAGRSKIAKKLAEEAIEVVIDAMNGDRNAVVRESADLLYNLVVVWAASGVRPGEVWKVRFRADNPGVWANHCHNLPHADAGMMLHLRYA